MGVTAETVRALRERTGAGMMECKRALLESSGDLDAAAEFLRRQGLAKADKKAERIAAEGVIALALAADERAGAMVEVNCETDFVARGEDFRRFAAEVAQRALARGDAELPGLLAAQLADGRSVEEQRRALVARLGENIGVRRSVRVASAGLLGAYLHGTRIGALVALEGGTAELAHDLAMHVAASRPRYLRIEDVPPALAAREREILLEQAQREGKSAPIVERIVEGRLRKGLAEMALLSQPFVKDPDRRVEQLLDAAGARVLAFERLEVGAGIEKKAGDFVGEVMAQVDGAGGGAGGGTSGR